MAVILGNDKDNTLHGTNDADTIEGFAGDDVVYGNAGDDVVYAGTDDDTVLGGAGRDQLFGQEGNDSLVGETDAELQAAIPGGILLITLILAGADFSGIASDLIYGGADNDTIDGAWAPDTLFGEAGDDLLLGRHGDDLLYGGQGSDTLDLGDGDDTVFGSISELSGDTVIGGFDTVPGGDRDWIRVADADVTAAVDGKDAAGGVDFDGDGTIDLHIPGLSSGIWQAKFDGTGTWISASCGLDIVGDGTDEELSGGACADTIDGGGGADTIRGRAEDDLLYGGAGADLLYGGKGGDRLDGGAGADTLDGGAGGDTLDGGGGKDLAYGGGGKDVLSGGAGDDSLFGDAGADTVLAGVDGDGADRIDGGDGEDSAVFEGLCADFAIVDLAGDGSEVTVTRIATGETDTLYDVEWLVFDDHVQATKNEAPVLAAPLADQAASELFPFAYLAGAGFADPDCDALVFSAALAGGGALPGWLAFDPATGAFSGTPGLADGGVVLDIELTATDPSGAETSDAFTLAVADLGIDSVVSGNAGANLLVGSPGNDLIEAKGGADTVFAQGGDDVVLAGNGADRVYGEGGDDTLFGGKGDDTLYGGGGADWFVIEDKGGYDTIDDFNLAGLFGPDTVAFLGVAGIADFASLQARMVNTGSGVFIDLDGGTPNPASSSHGVLLKGIFSNQLDAGDFVFL